MSPVGKFSTEDLAKVLKGAGLAAFGVVAAAVSNAATTGELDFRLTGWLAVAAFFSVVANSVRKLVTDTTW